MNFFKTLALVPALCASALSFSQTAAAQEKRAAADEPKATAAAERRRLVVEVVEAGGSRGGTFAVSEAAPDSYSTEISPPRRIDGWKRPEGEPPLTRIRLRLSQADDVVVIRVFAVLDDTWPPDAPGPKYGPREKAVGTYLVREGKTVKVELKGFGFEPLVLAVSEAKPEPEMPLIPAPARAVSRLKSVEVVSFLTEGLEMERARIVLRNVSQKNIVGLGFGDDGSTSMEQTFGPRPLIASGATYETEKGGGRRGGRELPGGGYEPVPQPEALVVGAAVFDDGSYEGDAKAAATMLARQKGRSIQFARVLKLVQDSLAADALDSQGALAQLKSHVGGLRIDVEPTALDELVSRFPEIPREECRRYVAEWAVDGMKMARVESLGLLEKVAGAQSQTADGSDLRRRLEEVRAAVEKRAGVARD